ncbi:MAG: fibronectin type III domain-containing protein [Janthinobacterium lividum]
MKNLFSWLGVALAAWGWLLPQAQAQVCAAPTNVGVSGATTTTVVVSFTPAAAVLGYVVRYSWTADSTAAGVVRRATASSPVTLTGLRAASSYRLAVGSICSPGDTVYTSPRLFTTASGPAATCGPVTNAQVSNISGVGATLSFTPVSGAASYTISYYAVGDTATMQTITTTSPGATLAGLLPGTAYVVRIKTNCVGGTTSPPVLVTFRTLANPVACGIVSNVVVTATSSSTATVSFTPGAGNTSFHITYHLANDSTHWVNTTASPAVLTGLLPGQTYYIQVVSVCGTGASTVYTGGGSITYNFRGAGPLSSRSALGAGAVELYPNPAHQAVSLLLPAMPGATTAQISLLNGLGQTIQTKQVVLSGVATQTQLDLVGVVPGLYTVRVAVGKQSASQRLAVE